MTHANGDRAKLEAALREAWQQFESGVSAFDLRYLAEGIDHRPYGWVVPVASGIATGSARELSRLLDQLGEAVETKSHLDVTLYFNPRLKPAA